MTTTIMIKEKCRDGRLEKNMLGYRTYFNGIKFVTDNKKNGSENNAL